MNIKVGESWVRHKNRNMCGLVVGVVSGCYEVESLCRWRWDKNDCIPCHPPRDKKPLRKVTWKDCEEWCLENCISPILQFSGPSHERWAIHFDNACLEYRGMRSIYAPTRIGVVLKARAAMRQEERGKGKR